jgi:hypothetical protein
MNNEPVAWMVDGVLFNSLGAALNISFDIEQPCIPLYTHPAKEYAPNQTLECSFDLAGFKPPAKTLTDKEIQEISYEHSKYGSIVNIYDFARAILRKAQEK